MSNKKPSMNSLLETYKLWVCNNPNVVTDVETIATWSSYLISGKINKSPLVSELVYAISKLVSFYNDRLIHQAYGNHTFNVSSGQHRFKLFLSVLHYTEVFIELLFRRKWGNKGKWAAVTALQTVKCVSSLILLYKFREIAISHPAIAPLQRKKIVEAKSRDENYNAHFTLKRSGRVLRRVEGSSPISVRDWQLTTTTPIESNVTVECKDMIIAETLHIVKPLVHLASIGSSGVQSWKQWMLPMAIDIATINMYSKQLSTLTTDQKLELSRRKMCLLLYLLRSPIYDQYSEDVITGVLQATARNAPALSCMCNPLLQYMSHWKDIYFYMWTS